MATTINMIVPQDRSARQEEGLMLYREGGHRQSLPEIGMNYPIPGFADIISHVSQAKHRAAMFVSI